jgi:hypothetical protein
MYTDKCNRLCDKPMTINKEFKDQAIPILNSPPYSTTTLKKSLHFPLRISNP